MPPKKTLPKTPQPTPAPVDPAPLAETQAPQDENLQEALWYVPYGVKSFADLIAAEQAYETAEHLERRTYQLGQLLRSILEDGALDDKVTAMQNLFDEFIELAQMVLNGTPAEGKKKRGMMDKKDMPDEEDMAMEAAENFAESATGVLTFTEGDPADTSKPPYIDMVIIQPGWGNKRDNFFYPAETLKRDAGIFVGAKQYETDHREEEKSTRTWVSTIEKIVGFTEDGAPIGRAVIHDPSFAERARNLKKAGLLNKLECSILASGKARAGYEENGRKGRWVETLEAASAVDWVTAAGAGGHALEFSELDHSKGDSMPPETPAPETPAPETPAAPATPAEAAVITENAPAVTLSEADVTGILAVAGLPAFAVTRLRENTYANAAALTAAIQKEKAYLHEAAQAGGVTGMGETQPPAVDKAAQLAEINAAKDAINKKYMR